MSNASATPTYRSGTQSVPAASGDSTLEERAIALEFLRVLADEVSKGTVDLPCFPDVVVRISHALADPNTTSDKVVTIVGAEPRLAARIVQTANSAAFNSSGKPLTDLRAAITRLGQQMVQSTAVSYAMQQVRDESLLKSIATPLTDLWNRSIEVASISRLLARRTRLAADEAFLAGLLHGIGKLYIMVRAAMRPQGIGIAHSWLETVAGWHASIGKAVLQSWGFSEEVCDAIGDQGDLDRRWKHAASLTDVLIAGTVLAEALHMPEPRSIGQEGIHAFLSIGVTPAECLDILKEAEEQIRLVHEALS